MPKLDITSLNSELKKGQIRPVYIIVGQEGYLAARSFELIKSCVVGDNADGMNASSYDGKAAKRDDVLSELRTVPMLGGRPFVVIRDGEKMTKEMIEALAEYLDSPVETATLVVVAEKLDGRTRFMQLATKRCAVVECKPLYDDKIPQWINMEFKRHGKQIAHDAASFLADLAGNDLGQLAQTIERVALFVGARKMIEVGDIEQSVADTHQRTIFELTDAIGNRNLTKAMSYLHNIIDGGQPPVLVLNMIARHFRILLKAREISGGLCDRAELAKYLGVHPFYAQNYVNQSKNFSTGQLKANFRLLHRCDRDLKSSRLPRERILEKTLLTIIRG